MNRLSFLICVGLCVCREAAHAEELQRRRVVRRPVAVAAITSDRVFVANRDTGTISVIDTLPATSPHIAGEFAVTDRLNDFVALPSGRCVAVDSSRHEVVAFNGSGPEKTIARRQVASYPVSIAAAGNNDVLSIASLWSRRLTLMSGDSLESLAEIDLPFAPLKQCLLDTRHVLVADAFGGRMAVVDVSRRRVQSHLLLDGQNIRGMAVRPASDGQAAEVLLTHQILNVASSTTRSIISWGGVLSNTLHTIEVNELLNSRAPDATRPDRIHGRLFPLGTQGRGAGDPGDVFVDDDSVWVALAGVNEVAVRTGTQPSLTRQSVPRRPTRLLRHGDSLLAVCTSDDVVAMLDPETLRANATIPLGPDVPRSPEQRGEELFFDARLSLDGWYSCHSCHADGHTIGRLNDNLGDDTLNTPKRILSLLGTGPTRPWAWNGSQDDLRNQVSKSIEQTMAGPGRGAPDITPREIEAIASYISALPPAPGILRARGQNNQPGVARGQKVFVEHGCRECHQPPHYTSPLTHDVGIKDEWGLHSFSPPSLRGVSQRDAFFHDNRATRLIDVFLDHDHDGASSLSKQQIDDLVLFLKTL